MPNSVEFQQNSFLSQFYCFRNEPLKTDSAVHIPLLSLCLPRAPFSVPAGRNSKALLPLRRKTARLPHPPVVSEPASCRGFQAYTLGLLWSESRIHLPAPTHDRFLPDTESHSHRKICIWLFSLRLSSIHRSFWPESDSGGMRNPDRRDASLSPFLNGH